jgi:endonuclease/exonuclease/phosphatase family metal-dependent hydrolase
VIWKKTIKTIQWNIGGGKLRQPDGDVNILASYNVDGLDSIIALLKWESPDIITLQEVHSDDRHNQVKIIAEATGLAHYVSDFFADSHIEQGQRLGQGIISRFPISKRHSQLLYNPHYEVTWEDGSKAISHDKGITSCVIDIEGFELTAKTLHLTPFRRFGIDPLSEAASRLLEDVQSKIEDGAKKFIIQGDFNLNFVRLGYVLPHLIDSGVQEVPQDAATTPKNRRTDHILYRGIRVIGSSVIKTSCKITS